MEGVRMLFDDAVKMYMDDKRARLRATTIEGYESAMKCHLLPAWGGREVEAITHEELQVWVDSIATAGAAGKAFKTFRQVYRWTIRKLQLRIWDVTQGVELPKRRVSKRERMTAPEERRMLRAVMGEPYEAVVLAGAALGLRPSEAAGLDWSDVDWRSGWVHVQRGAHTVRGGATVEYGCKTELADRWLKLPRWALERLRQLRRQRRSGRMRGDLSPRCIYARLKRMLKRIGLPSISMEALRHTWATIAIEAGAALADVAVALGHTSVEMCRRHYLLSTRAVVERAELAFSRAVVAP